MRLAAGKHSHASISAQANGVGSDVAAVAGIDRVLELIPEPRAAWRFVSEESQFFETPQRPIDALRTGRIDEVLAAARRWGDAFT